MSWFTFIAGACMSSVFDDVRAGRPTWWVWLFLGLLSFGFDVYFGQEIYRKYQVLLDATKLVHKTMLRARRPVCDFPEIAGSLQFLTMALKRIREIETPEKTKPQ